MLAIILHLAILILSSPHVEASKYHLRLFPRLFKSQHQFLASRILGCPPCALASNHPIRFMEFLRRRDTAQKATHTAAIGTIWQEHSFGDNNLLARASPPFRCVARRTLGISRKSFEGKRIDEAIFQIL